jgi:predicted enzyme related to lactoylglutathione lyase
MAEIRHVLTILAVADLAVATRFYRDAFGWPQLVEAPVYAEFGLPGGMRLGVYERHAFARNVGQLPSRVARGEIAATEIYLHTTVIEDAIRRIRAAGGRELSALGARAWGDDAAYFADPRR